MKKIVMALVTVTGLAMSVSSAQAAIKLEIATVQNGVSYIQGTGAAKGAQIFWEGSVVTTANKVNGGFSFFGVLPTDCVGSLSDQAGGANPVNVQVLGCTPTSTRALVPQTGQTTSYDSNTPQRDDGATQKGVPLPTPRFTDNSNGTITDNLTGLTWLKNANCAQQREDWSFALTDVVELNTVGTMRGFDCGDRSNAGSHQTDWRLPNVRELGSLVDYSSFQPSFPADNPFTNLQAFPPVVSVSPGAGYWSSSSPVPPIAWSVDFYYGTISYRDPGPVGDGGVKDNFFFVMAVRGGQ
jgi:hypothetical protein